MSTYNFPEKYIILLKFVSLCWLKIKHLWASVDNNYSKIPYNNQIPLIINFHTIDTLIDDNQNI